MFKRKLPDKIKTQKEIEGENLEYCNKYISNPLCIICKDYAEFIQFTSKSDSRLEGRCLRHLVRGKLAIELRWQGDHRD